MEKRSPACFEKYYASCLSSLVRNFNSRLSPNPKKLLLDIGISNSSRKLDLPDYAKMGREDTDDDNGNEEKLVTSGLTSIRTLIEEEMSITLNPKVHNGELDRVESDLEPDIHLKKNHHKKSKKYKVETYPQTASPSINFDLAAYMVEFYCENYHYQEKQADSNTKPCSAVEESHLIEKALADIADIFLCQKFIDPNLTTNEHAQSKEFMDALEKLNSNKELFFKLIEDQKSLLLKHVEDLHGVSPKNFGRLAEHEELVTRYPFQKHNWDGLFLRKKYKLKERRPSKGSGSSAQLPQGVKHHKNMERLFSSFSFRKLKTRLRRVFGESRKSKHAVSLDGNRILHGSGHSVDIDTNDTKYKFQPLPIMRKKDEQSKQKELGLPDSGESSLYEDAKRHLAELLAALDENASLRKPLPSPEYETQVVDSTLLCTRGDLLNLKGTSEIFDPSDIISIEEQDRSGTHTESSRSEPNFKSEEFGGEGSCKIFESGASDDKLEIPVPSASISSFLHIKEQENLEAVIPEDSLSSGSTTVDNHVDFHQKPQEIHSQEHGNYALVLISSGSEEDPKNCLGDKEVILGFVKTLLEASGLSCNETSERWRLSDQLVDSSLFDKLANSFGLLSDDPDLLFDYINEVLAETQDRLFGCTPWVSIIKPGIPLILTRNVIGEVCKSIDRHFPEKQFPYIPDELELDIWMDLQLETDDVVTEMTDDILEEIMDRIVFELQT